MKSLLKKLTAILLVLNIVLPYLNIGLIKSYAVTVQITNAKVYFLDNGGNQITTADPLQKVQLNLQIGMASDEATEPRDVEIQISDANFYFEEFLLDAGTGKYLYSVELYSGGPTITMELVHNNDGSQKIIVRSLEQGQTLNLNLGGYFTNSALPGESVTATIEEGNSVTLNVTNVPSGVTATNTKNVSKNSISFTEGNTTEMAAQFPITYTIGASVNIASQYQSTDTLDKLTITDTMLFPDGMYINSSANIADYISVGNTSAFSSSDFSPIYSSSDNSKIIGFSLNKDITGSNITDYLSNGATISLLYGSDMNITQDNHFSQLDNVSLDFTKLASFMDAPKVSRDGRDYNSRPIINTFQGNRAVLAAKTELARFLTGKHYTCQAYELRNGVKLEINISNVPATFTFQYNNQAGKLIHASTFTINVVNNDKEGTVSYPFSKAGLNECLDDLKHGRVKTADKAKSYTAYTVTLDEVVKRFNGDARKAMDRVRELIASQDIIGVESNTFATVYAIDSLFPKMKKEGSIDNEPTKEDCLAAVYAILQPGEPMTVDQAEKDLNSLFFSERRYDLGRVGRYKLNKKFDYQEDIRDVTLVKEDIINTMKFLIKVYIGDEQTDDIDHLGNRRIRSVGELMTNNLKTAFARMERIAKERMSLKETDTMKPQDLISIKPIVANIKE